MSRNSGKRPVFQESTYQNVPSSRSSPRSSKRSKGSMVDEFKNLHMLSTASPDIIYILFSSLKPSYALSKNNCVSIRLLDYSNKTVLNVDGYRLRHNQSVTVCTYFDHNCTVRFAENEQRFNSTSLPSPVNMDLFLNEAFEGPEDSKAFLKDYERKLFSGDIVLLRLETDLPALNRITRTMIYLDYGITDVKAEEPLRTKLHKDAGNKADHGLERSFFQETRPVGNLQQIHTDLQLSKRDIVFVIGAKNVGKSSLIHYLINAEVSKSSSNPVYYLEGDPGQTEFAPQGILSLTKLDSYISTLSGSKFMLEKNDGILTSSSKGLWSQILGTNNVENLVTEYLEIVKALFEKYSNLKQRGTLFVNTMGWITDEGLKILLKMFDMIQPTKVVYLNPDRPRSPESEDFPLNEALAPIARMARFKLFVHQPCSSGEFKSSPYKQSKIQRQITQIAYLTAALSPDINAVAFAGIKKRVSISLDDVIIHHSSGERIDPVQMLDILHHSWIFFGTLPTLQYHVSKKYILETESTRDLELDLDTFDDDSPAGEEDGNGSDGTELESNHDDDESEKEEGELDDTVLPPPRSPRSPTGSPTPPKASFLISKHLPLGGSCLGAGFVRSINQAENRLEVLGPLGLTDTQIKAINLIVIGNKIPTPMGFVFESDSHQEDTPYRGHNVGESNFPSLEKSKEIIFKRQIIENINVPKYLDAVLKELLPENKKPEEKKGGKKGAAGKGAKKIPDTIPEEDDDEDGIIIL